MGRHQSGLFPLILTALTGLLLREIPNERPQLFSFIFMPLILFLLEKGGESGGGRNRALLALPLTMLLWANTHGAYILGDGLIAIALAGRLLPALRRQEPVDYPYLAAALAALAASLINPTGVLAWSEFFHTLPAYASAVYENLSPWYVASRLHDWHPAYWAYLAICLVGIGLARQRMAPAHLLTLACLVTLSLTGLRYLIFPLLASPLLVRYLPVIPWDGRRVVATLVGLAIWVGCSWDSSLLKFTSGPGFPAAAADFLRRENPAPQLFNYYDWGGYLSWTVPGVKTFLDGRGLVEELYLLQDRVLNGDAWQESLDRHHINTVLIPGMSEIPGDTYPLTGALAAAPDWQPVFADDTALIFVRRIPANSRVIARHPLARQVVQMHLVKSAERLIAQNPRREEYWLTKANALQLLGDRPGALAAYRETLRINPRNSWAARMLANGGN
jgi:hypothetical protein